MPTVTRIFPWGQDVLEKGSVIIRAADLYVNGKRRKTLKDVLSLPERRGNFVVHLCFQGEDVDVAFENSSKADRFQRDCDLAIRKQKGAGLSPLVEIEPPTPPTSVTPQPSVNDPLETSATKGPSPSGTLRKRRVTRKRSTDSLDDKSFVSRAGIVPAAELALYDKPFETHPRIAPTAEVALYDKSFETHPKIGPIADIATKSSGESSCAMSTGPMPDTDNGTCAAPLIVPEDYVHQHWDDGEILRKTGLSEVRLCIHKVSHQRQVLKMVRKDAFLGFCDKKMSSLSLFSEATLLQSLDHPNIVRLFDSFQTSSNIFLVMEFMPGGELLENIRTQGRFDEPQARRIFLDVLAAVGYIHRLGIVHRDIKCENILLSSKERGVDMSAKLADFGLSRLAATSQDCHTYCGTVLHMAPEVIKCRLHMFVRARSGGNDAVRLAGYGLQADMYSLGVLLYIILCGHPPVTRDIGEQCKMWLGAAFEENDSDWADLTSPARDLVTQLRADSPKQRPGSHQVKNHPWLRNFIDTCFHNSSPKRRCLSFDVKVPSAAISSMAPLASNF